MKKKFFKSFFSTLVLSFFGLSLFMVGTASADDYYNYGKYTPLDVSSYCVGVAGWVKDYGIRNVWGDEEQYVYYLDSSGWIHKYEVWLTNEGSIDDPTPYINPHQHPENPDALGPIEPRHFAYVSSHFVEGDAGDLTHHAYEIHVDASGIYIGANRLGIHNWDHEWNYAGQIAPLVPPERTESLAYNPDDNIWYAGGRFRTIYQLSDTDIDGDFMDETWVAIFTHDDYAGGHHDGMEYAGGFLWISDMTSDMIGKWEEVSPGEWSEVATYTYSEIAYVEGMGFGPNDHFWIGGGWSDYDYFYEIGGGKLIVEIPVYTDIKPGSCPNPLNLKSKGVLPVAVLGTEDFDVTTIDPVSIVLTREGYEDFGVSPLRWSLEDVATPFDGELCECHDLDGDGYLDLTLKFDTQALVETLNLAEAAGETIPLILTGNLKEEEGGTPIRGSDCIKILETGDKK